MLKVSRLENTKDVGDARKAELNGNRKLKYLVVNSGKNGLLIYLVIKRLKFFLNILFIFTITRLLSIFAL